MNLVFAGTPAFALASLAALLDAGHAIKAVYTQPDRPAGRGRQLKPSPVKALALERGLPLLQPLSLRDPDAKIRLRAFRPDALVVVAYGQILPADILGMAALGAINVHASLLPRWRGAAPIQRALLAGDEVTGISIMQLDEGLDTGPIWLQRELPITASDTYGGLYDRLAELGAKLLVEALEGITAGTLVATPQPTGIASYAHKLRAEDAWINWFLPATQISRMVRALNPSPVAKTYWNSATLKVWEATAVQSTARSASSPGTISQVDRRGIEVITGDGILRIERLQVGGSRSMNADDFLHGHTVLVGTQLGSV